MKHLRIWIVGSITFFLIFGLFIHLLFARTHSSSLDAMMTEEEKQTTGIYKLSVLERIELKSWIDKHYIPKKQTTPGRASYRLPEVSQVLYAGHFIRLDDGTLWEIYPADTQFTESWITPAAIEVELIGAGEYPYTLKNTVTGTKVRAKKAYNLP